MQITTRLLCALLLVFSQVTYGMEQNNEKHNQLEQEAHSGPTSNTLEAAIEGDFDDIVNILLEQGFILKERHLALARQCNSRKVGYLIKTYLQILQSLKIISWTTVPLTEDIIYHIASYAFGPLPTTLKEAIKQNNVRSVKRFLFEGAIVPTQDHLNHATKHKAREVWHVLKNFLRLASVNFGTARLVQENVDLPQDILNTIASYAVLKNT
jgi:hypothetical protein